MVNRAERGHVPPALVVLILLLIGVIVVCVKCRGNPEPSPAASPTPPAHFSNPDSVARDAILAYARSLRFDTTGGAGDEQRLMLGTTCPPWAVGGNCTYGPLARIAPESGSHLIPDSGALANGRIIARIVTVDSQYPKLGLRGGDTTYWWVDAKGPYGWRSVLVPSNPSDSLVHRDSLWFHKADPNRSYKWKQAIARFLWTDSDEQLWSTCTNGYCCKIR
jgi:hypothetical protein